MINPKDKLSIRRQCELIHLNRPDVYYKHTENEKKREYEEQLMKHIDALHTKYPCLGSRKLVNRRVSISASDVNLYAALCRLWDCM